MGKLVLLLLAAVFFSVWLVGISLYKIMQAAFAVSAFLVLLLCMGIAGAGKGKL